MIEIIEKGVKPEQKKYRKKCGNCKTIFTYQNDDREVFGSYDYWYYCVKCPICKNVLTTSIFDRREKNK